MDMPKSRDIQAKIPLPQAIWNEFWLRYCERSEQWLSGCSAQQVQRLLFLLYLQSEDAAKSENVILGVRACLKNHSRKV